MAAGSSGSVEERNGDDSAYLNTLNCQHLRRGGYEIWLFELKGKVHTLHGLGLNSNTNSCWATRFICVISAALGSPVVPLLNSLAAVVVLERFSSSNRTQSCSPCSSSSVQDTAPSGTDCPRTSNTRIRCSGIDAAFAAVVIASKCSGSVMTKFVAEERK